MERTSRALALLLLGAVGCGGSSPGGDGSEASSDSFTTLGPTAGNESSGTSAGDATASGTSTTPPNPTAADGSTGGGPGDDTDDDGPKFDLPPQPDVGVVGCGEGGGGGEKKSSFSNIWVANAPEGTVSKIDTVTAVELARYRTTTNAPDQPSRTSVNQFGDIAAGHRFAARVVKIAAQEEDCVDLNGNGLIDTSSGPADIRDFGTDECLLWETDLTPAASQGTRAVAWEGGTIDPATCENTNPNPRLWVAYGSNPLQVFRLDGETGDVLDQTTISSTGFVYGGAVNAAGDFWVSDRSGRTLSRVDGVTLDVDTYPVPGSAAYGMGVDGDGQPWIATYASGAGVDFVYRFDTATETFVEAGGVTGRYRGMAIDRDDRIWVAGNAPCRLAAFDRVNESVIDDAIALPGCSDPVGVTVDRDGFVWVVDRGASVAWKVDPATYTIAATVEGLTSPYTYSDFSGSGLDLVINPPG